MIACFWEREDAAAVAERLGGVVRRGRFHGEDDDEDHPWIVVLADPDRLALDEALDEYDGWLEDDSAVRHGVAPAAGSRPQDTPPVPLPTEPKRFKR
ncbi:hypothetical protein ACQHIV_02825 [Kribbella sp. GL6]|uniref:hypothetical protein n=1 Tax=Kribbella sp. GL6 TaxID=3419765 RepID=UPI003D05B77D